MGSIYTSPGKAKKCIENQKARITELEKRNDRLQQRYLDLLEKFSHMHVNDPSTSDDSCAVCGFDLRNSIHHA